MSAGEVSVAELATHLPAGAFVLDVREPDEYEDAHIPGAALVPLGEIATRHDDVPRDRPVYVVCAVGGRSARAAQFLAHQGVDAYNVAGGTQAWIRAGLPVAVGGASGAAADLTP